MPFSFLIFVSESYGLPRQPPLEVAIAQATECMKLMSKAGIGSCAFAGVQDYLHWWLLLGVQLEPSFFNG